MEIVNVIEIINGVVSKVISCPVKEGKQAKAEELAFKTFLKLARENGIGRKDEKIAVAFGEWDSGNGYNVLVFWSTMVVE